MRAPPMEVYLDWIVSAWDSLSKELIQNSFKVISNAIDGSEDDQIHCFKSEGPCHGGRELLRSEAEKLNSVPEFEIEEVSENPDMEQDKQNGYASDASVEYI